MYVKVTPSILLTYTSQEKFNTAVYTLVEKNNERYFCDTRKEEKSARVKKKKKEKKIQGTEPNRAESALQNLASNIAIS